MSPTCHLPLSIRVEGLCSSVHFCPWTTACKTCSSQSYPPTPSFIFFTTFIHRTHTPFIFHPSNLSMIPNCLGTPSLTFSTTRATNPYHHCLDSSYSTSASSKSISYACTHPLALLYHTHLFPICLARLWYAFPQIHLKTSPFYP